MKIILDVPAPQDVVDRLQAQGAATIECLTGNGFDRPARRVDPQLAAGAEIWVAPHAPLNLADLPGLRWLQITSTGYDQLLGLGLDQRPALAVTNTRGCCDLQIGEWCLASMINLARGLRVLLANQEAAIWDRTAAVQGEIRRRTVGFWGYGGYARETARLARHCGMTVHAYTRNGPRTREATYVVEGTGDPDAKLPHRFFTAGQEREFLGGLNFLILACPLTAATRGAIGEPELRAMRPTAFLLNPARGPIVQEAALLRALSEGWIAGAALDTHFSYPLPPEHPLWRMRNVLLTPHLAAGGATPQFVERFWDLLCQNLSRYRTGLPLLNRLTSGELQGQ
jgi:phosphoglycerate dehydrogenase-like enzyme